MSDRPTALSANSSAEAVLVPHYEGPITNSHSGSYQSVPEGVILVEPSPVNHLTTVERGTHLDFHINSSAALALPQTDDTEAQMHAVQYMTSPPSATWESPQLGAAMHRVELPALNVSPLATPLSADMPDSPDYGAALAQALTNLCRRASEQTRVQAAQQAVSECHNSSQVGAGSSKSGNNAAETISDDLTAMVDSFVSSEALHAAVDQVLDDLLVEVAAPLKPVQRSMPVDTGGVSPMVSPRVSLPANLLAPQHAAVDKVLDNLLAEVAAPLKPVQSSKPVDTSRVKPTISPRVSLPANLLAAQHAEVDQVLDDLLAEVSSSLQPVQNSLPGGTSEATLKVSLPSDKGSAEQMLASLPPTPAPDNLSTRASNRSPPRLARLGRSSSKPLAAAKEPAGTPVQPAGVACKLVLAEAQLLVPSSSSSNKENDPIAMLETGWPGKVRKQTGDKAGDGSMVIRRGGCLDGRTFQQMAQALPTEPASQVMQLVPAHTHMQLLAGKNAWHVDSEKAFPYPDWRSTSANANHL